MLVTSEVRVEHGVADAISDFVRVALTDGFAGEQELSCHLFWSPK
jgi:hypothetical protein